MELTIEQIRENSRRFKEIFTANVINKGIQGGDKFLDYLENETDFFTAPASTRYHLCCEGGLCQHSLNVYKELIHQVSAIGEDKIETGRADKMASYTIVALLHDICKVDFYKVSKRNKKDEATGKWYSVPYYEVDEKDCVGYHGPKSQLIISEYIKLTKEESVAIMNHMGPFDRPSGDYSLTNAYSMYPFALITFFADMAASNIDET